MSYEQLLLTLPTHKNWIPSDDLVRYQNFWYGHSFLSGTLNFQFNFKPLPSDTILATTPKSGTTWLMPILFSILHRHLYPIDSPNHPLTTHHPHHLVPILEQTHYLKTPSPDLSEIPSPRLLATHTPFTSLPASLLDDPSCKIVYLCRDPRDTLVSLWHFMNSMMKPGDGVLPLEEGFEFFVKGVSMYGPFWDHVLGYWKESLERPSRVLFLKYEGIKADSGGWVRRIAEFLGCPFSAKEEEDGVVEKIVEACRFERMRELEPNKGVGELHHGTKRKSLFRRGEVGDWKNYLTKEMGDELERITLLKLFGSGLQILV